MTTANVTQARPVVGIISFVFGALALLMVLTQFWAGPFAPQQRVEVTIGEIAADIRQSALRKLKGLPQPKKVQAPWTTDKMLQLIASLLAGCALIAGGASYVRHENWRAAATGTFLGVGAIVFQLIAWSILVLAGAIIVYAIIHNIPGILGE